MRICLGDLHEMKKMKQTYIALLVLFTGILGLVYYQLLYQPKIVNAGYLINDKVFSGHTDEVWSAKFSPNDSLIVSSGYEQNTIIWSRVTGEIIHKLEHPYGSQTVDFNPKGKTIVTGSYDGKARIWDVNTGELLKILYGHEGALRSVAYNPSGNLIAAGGDDDIVTIWNAKSGDIIFTLKNSEKDIWSVTFSPSGDKLLTGGSDNKIRIYDVSTGKLLNALEGHSMVVLSLAFSPDGKLLASGSDDKTVKVWDTSTWNLLHSLKGENQAIHSAVFIDNNRILSGGTDKKILGELLEYHLGYQGSLNYTVATLWDIQNETVLQTITEHENDLGTQCDVSSNGNWLATPSSDGTVKLWNISN